jgi:ethanolamine utilization cobalamin adenosyltransferase
MTEKPEHMTHLSGNRLVPKTHPRIRLRGKLDSLEAALLCAQRQAQDGGRTETAAGLADCFALTQRLLGAEVKGSSPGAFSLLGMDPDRLRYVTHHVPEEFGIPHPAPHAGMGALCLTLNALRTQVRETELAAAEAYAGHREPTGDGILLALNRMSSAVYILFLREWKAGNG